MSKQINIGGRIHSTEVGNVSVGANEVFDDTKGKKQNVINRETDAELLRLDQSKQNNLTFDNTPTENSNNPVKSSGVYAADKALSDAIEAILLLIPSAATALNQLADKAFVNSSVSTATATFRGTYNVVTDLELAYDATHEQIATKLGQVIATADNNDYAFVQVPVSATSTDIRRTERYKFNGTVWGYEYDLNTSGFTAAQWEAINSAITAALVQKLSALPTAQELAAALVGKQDVLTFDNAPASGSSNPVKSGGVYTAVNDEKVARENADTGFGNRITAIENVIPSAASSSNKLVDNSAMADAIGVVTAIIGQMDATFNLTTTDGHITLHVTQVDGVITSVQVQSSDIASAAALTLVANDLSALTTRVGTAEGNITSLTGRMTTAEGDIETLQDLYNALQQSAPQVIEPTDTWPVANPSNTVIYRVIDRVNTPPEYYSDYMWNGTSMVLMATYNNAIDTTPKKDSANLITSGGVFANIGAFDVSEYHKSGGTLATYADLSAALAAVPTDYQKGGMSIKFVQSSDNKYVQYRLMSDSFNTTVANWQGVDDVPTAGSDNLVKSGGVEKEFNDKVGTITNPMEYVHHGYAASTGWYSVNDPSSRHYITPVEEGDTLVFQPSYASYYAWLSDYTEPVNGATVPFVSGYGERIYIQNETTLVAPIGVKYLYFTNQAPTKLIVNGVSRLSNGWMYGAIEENKHSIESVEKDINDNNLSFGEFQQIKRMCAATRWYNADALLLNIKSSVPVSINITRPSSFYYALLSDYSATDTAPQYATGYTERVLVSDGILRVQSTVDAKYLIVLDFNDYNTFTVNGYDCLNGTVWNRLLSIPSNTSINPAPTLYPHNNLPCVSLRFDDCHNNDSQVFNLCERYGVKCGFAFIASQENMSQKGERYLAWNKSGYSMICHSLDWKSLTLQYYNSVADIEEAMTTSFFRMRDYGMTVNSFSAPGGESEATSWQMISNICAYAYRRTSPEILPTRSSDPCSMNGPGIQNKSLQQIKDEIDDAITNNQYINLYGHAEDFGTTYSGTYKGESWEVLYDINFVEQILQYILQKRNNGEVYFGSPNDCAKYFFNL